MNDQIRWCSEVSQKDLVLCVNSQTQCGLSVFQLRSQNLPTHTLALTTKHITIQTCAFEKDTQVMRFISASKYLKPRTHVLCFLAFSVCEIACICFDSDRPAGNDQQQTLQLSSVHRFLSALNCTESRRVSLCGRASEHCIFTEVSGS